MSDTNIDGFLPPHPSVLTKRVVSVGLEKHLDTYHKILDHGFIAVKDYMGDDESVVQMARVSYGRGTKGARDDEALLRYLMRHSHTSPFEGCVIKLHVKCPIFVMRQWVRHRTASLNEYSARYSIMPDEFYQPAAEDLAVQSRDNKQGRDGRLSPEEADEVLKQLNVHSRDNFALYHKLLNLDDKGQALEPDKAGLARELARITLPLSTYTEMYWQINLHNLLHFLHLRADHHAQWEIRVYADKILEIVRDWMPLTYQAFLDYRHHAASVSAPEKRLLKDILAGRATVGDGEKYGLSKRELREFVENWDL